MITAIEDATLTNSVLQPDVVPAAELCDSLYSDQPQEQKLCYDAQTSETKIKTQERKGRHLAVV
jgi:hypothetical protein